MSANGRGRERIPFDYYPTPPWCVHRLLDRVAGDLGLTSRPANYHPDDPPLWVLEPNVGDGAIVRAVDSWLADYLGPRSVHPVIWTGVELRRGALDPRTQLWHHAEGVDFRTWEPPEEWRSKAANGRPRKPFDLAIGNPPFSQAEGVIRRCIELAEVTVMLLRVGFLGSADRIDFWRGPGELPGLFVIPDRPSFDGQGTDSSTYAWFVWSHEWDRVGAGLGGRVEVLDATPAAVRAAQLPTPPTALPQVGLFDEGTT